jgi:hypothetical protein
MFFVGGREYMTLVGYKRLPQGSILSPFVYSFIGSCVDRFVPAGCGFLEYTDDLVVYVTHRLIGWLLGLSRLLAPRCVFSFLRWVSQYPLQSPKLCCFPENTSALRF